MNQVYNQGFYLTIVKNIKWLFSAHFWTLLEWAAFLDHKQNLAQATTPEVYFTNFVQAAFA